MRRGHPWVFAESIREQNRAGTNGELAVIFDRNDKFLAVGLYDADSPIRVRILHSGSPENIDAEWFRVRLKESIALRNGILDERTHAARLVNGESDRFPALVIDRYGETLVLKLYSAIWFPWLSEMLTIVRDEVPADRIVLRLSRNIQAPARAEGYSDGQVLFGSPIDKPVTFLESGLRFEADVLKGQKTGFFLDQRENRRIVESLARGKDVLNAFSFSGGFSLYAARGGARSVTDVDISAHALESSRRNFGLNESAVARVPHELIQADVFEWLQAPAAKRYDLIILDPPSLAKRQADRPAALKAYTALANAGLTRAKSNATLVCCSCSAHIRPEEFFTTTIDALRRSGRNFEVLRQTHEPPDHHATFPEAQYLKAIYFQLT